MSFNIESAFNRILDLQSRTVTLWQRKTGTDFTVKIASSNYFRNMAGPEEIVVDGREFVISRKALEALSYGVPRRGDKIIDSDLGADTITYVREMVILGVIVGYRIRTG